MKSETPEQKIARLEAENAALKQKSERAVSLKVSEKGGVSMYGLGRFPVTLYKEQWAVVIAKVAEIEKFIKDNDKKLKSKGE